MLDYKITKLNNDKNNISVTVRVYRGSNKMVQETDILTNKVSNVNKYVRSAMIGEYDFSFKLGRKISQMNIEQLVRAYVNNKLAGIAFKKREVINTFQRDISKLEPVIGEKMISRRLEKVLPKTPVFKRNVI